MELFCSFFALCCWSALDRYNDRVFGVEIVEQQQQRVSECSVDKTFDPDRLTSNICCCCWCCWNWWKHSKEYQGEKSGNARVSAGCGWDWAVIVGQVRSYWYKLYKLVRKHRNYLIEDLLCFFLSLLKWHRNIEIKLICYAYICSRT